MTLLSPSGTGGGGHAVEIPSDLYRQLQRVLENSRFNSVDDFALYVLRDLASHPSRVGDKGGPAAGAGQDDKEEPLTSEEIEIIQERLQNLGYL
ncbi:MAG: hypothetical protein QOG21_586 [Actinomycetota bacterium]|jgi:peptidoglycan hydrolase-like protein with peptidoglycan-binding domain|nr:hypothetical protein [Actinomycetota bacterium]